MLESWVSPLSFSDEALDFSSEIGELVVGLASADAALVVYPFTHASSSNPVVGIVDERIDDFNLNECANLERRFMLFEDFFWRLPSGEELCFHKLMPLWVFDGISKERHWYTSS